MNNYGKPEGLRARLADWADRMGRDRSLPWAGLGIIGDLRLASRILNLREFAEDLRVKGTDEQRQFADDILRLDETAEATDSALCTAGLINFDPPAAIETLAREREQAQRDVRQVREFLTEQGMLAEGDTETPLVPLLRVLLL